MIENTILEKKHHLMQVLSNAELLKRNTELEVLQDELAENRLEEVMTIWNYTFSNLIREGLVYDYIKNTDPTKDIVRLTIDSVQYDCLASALKDIFQNEYSELISDNDAVVASDVVEIIEESNNDSYVSKEEYDKLQETISALKLSLDEQMQKTNLILTQQKEAVQSQEDASKSNKDPYADFNTTFARSNNDVNEEPVSLEQETIDLNIISNEEKVVETQKEEKCKSISTFIYDVYDLTILPPGASTGENVKVIIAPLEASYDDSHPEIMAMMINRLGHAEKFVSQGNLASLKVKFDENEYLLRGSFSQGKFISHVIPAGATMSMGYSINKNNVIERRSLYPELTHHGHLAFTAYNTFFHIIPTSLTNDANGIAPCLICTIDEEGNKEVFTTATKGFTTYRINNKAYHILTYWEKDILCAEILAA